MTEGTKSFALGIDIGGTFTDLVLSGPAGERHALKVLTTPDDPSRAVVEGVRTLLGQSKVAAKSVARVVHATTLFTNALIERKGAVTGLITTAGFRDVLEIGRERRFELYDLNIRMPEPLVPRDLRLEVAERTAADGSIGTAVDEAELHRAGAALAEAGVASIAVVFLNSYANPQNEQRAAAALRKAFPKIALTASHEIVPEVREFERSSTAAANAYVKPLAAHYLEGIRDKLGALGIGAPLSLMLSSGGFTHIAEAKAAPVHLLESGPAAGALAAAHLGKGEARLLAFDMGGTTAKALHRRRRHPAGRARASKPGARGASWKAAACRSACPAWISSRSARAAAASRTPTRSACSRSARKARARCPAPPAMAWAERSRR